MRYDNEEELPNFDPKGNYTGSQLDAYAEQLLREDARGEMCRTCNGRGQPTGEIEAKEQEARDGKGNSLTIEFPEFKCKRGHRWYAGEGAMRGIGGENPILFKEHFDSRKRREIYCVDSETECLTSGGWTSWRDLEPGLDILAFDPTTRTTRWEPISEVFIEEEYDGPMVRLYGQSFEALVTPDHRWPVERASGIEVFRTHNLPPTKGRLFLGAEHIGTQEQTVSSPLVRILAWNLTEGHVWGSKKAPRIAITQSRLVNPENVADIRNDIISMGASFEAFTPGSNVGSNGFQRRDGLYCREVTTQSGATQFILSGSGVDEIVNISGRDRIPPVDFLRRLTKSQLEDYVTILLAGDGDGKSKFYQWHRGRMDSAMAAFVLAGYGTSVSSRGDACTVRGRRGSLYRWLHRLERESVNYGGVIWCPVTPSGHWVARRNGSTFITGNTACGTPDPEIVSGLYNRSHPQGRKINSEEQRRKNGASYYR